MTKQPLSEAPHCQGDSSRKKYLDISLQPPSILREVPPSGQTQLETRGQRSLEPSPGHRDWAGQITGPRLGLE